MEKKERLGHEEEAETGAPPPQRRERGRHVGVAADVRGRSTGSFLQILFLVRSFFFAADDFFLRWPSGRRDEDRRKMPGRDFS